MLNIYDDIFKITNPKLYNSPYKVNIDQVWQVLKNYKMQARLIFLNNLRTVSLEFVDNNNQEKINSNSFGNYQSDINKIHLKSNLDSKILPETLNHELFHMASSRRGKKTSGITDGNNFALPGNRLNEGITEYLGLKSLKQKNSTSGYELELFVTQFLTFIYGEKILEPYFQGNSQAFFNQFKQFGISPDLVFKLDQHLKKIDKNANYQNSRLIYLICSDIFPNSFTDDIEVLRNLELNQQNTYLINKTISQFFNTQKENEYMDKIQEITISEYQYQNLDLKEICDNYTSEYITTQKNEFREILDILFFMAENKNISFDRISNFIQRILSYKGSEFKYLYKNTIYEKLEIQAKKR